MGFPQMGWSTFARSDFILVPLPAARIMVHKRLFPIMFLPK